MTDDNRININPDDQLSDSELTALLERMFAAVLHERGKGGAKVGIVLLIASGTQRMFAGNVPPDIARLLMSETAAGIISKQSGPYDLGKPQ